VALVTSGKAPEAPASYQKGDGKERQEIDFERYWIPQRIEKMRFPLVLLMVSRVLWASTTPSQVRQRALEGDGEAEFFDVSASYIIFLPGGVQFDIPVSSYDHYFISIMNELAREVADRVFDPSAFIKVLWNSTDADDNNDDERYLMISSQQTSPFPQYVSSHWTVPTQTEPNFVELPMPTIQLELPTRIEQIQEIGFTDSPTLTSQGTFSQGPCPSRLGSADKDRCEEVEAFIRFVLLVPTRTEVIEALKTTFEDELQKAILSGRMDEMLLEDYPWSDIVILSGYPISNAPIPSTNDAEGKGESQNGVQKLSVVSIGAILLGVFLFFSVVLLVAACRVRKSRTDKGDQTPNEVPQSHTTENYPAPIRIVSTSPPDTISIEVSGLEWGHETDCGEQEDSRQVFVVKVRKPFPIPARKPVSDANPSCQSNDYSDSSVLSTMSPVSSMRSSRGLVATQRDPSIQDENAVEEQPNEASISVTSMERIRHSTSMDFSSSYSVQSNESSTGTASIFQGTPMVSLHKDTQVSPMDVKDFDAFEAAIMAGDWKAVEIQAAALDTMRSGSEGTLPGSRVRPLTSDVSTCSSSNRDPIRPRKLDDDMSSIDDESGVCAEGGESFRPAALDAVKTSENCDMR
jgi:hypothetical protein